MSVADRAARVAREAVAKTCRKCLALRKLEDFYRDKRALDGKVSWCRFCYTAYKHSDRGKVAVERYETSEKRREATRRYHASAGYKEYDRRYRKGEVCKAAYALYNRSAARKEQRVKCRSKTTKYVRTRHQNDEKYRLKVVLRARLRSAIKHHQKAGSAVSDLQCTIPELRLFLELFFRPGMTWNNWGKGPGKWQIDHRRPLASFDLADRDQLRQACCFVNLQPLWYEDHLQKTTEDVRALR